MILLIGVAVFSYIMGVFIQILDEYGNLNAELDEGDQLSKFFGLIKHYNDNLPLDLGLKERIEDHFENLWQQDRNQAIDCEEEEAILFQLPVET